MAPDAFFLQVADGQRFCLFHRPEGNAEPRAALVFIHPFAEEMNKSRRMAALQARALAATGCAVLQIDLHGCGDSSGDFGDATWESWTADVLAACAWLRGHSAAPLWLWGLRAGCLLAVDAAARLNEPVNFLFWHPVQSGKQFLQQFLRLKMAGELLGGDGKAGAVSTELARQQLAQGEAVEVAGYLVSPGLAAGLERAELAPPVKPCRAEWLEMSAKTDAVLTPVAARRLEQWQAAGHRARGAVVTGPSFWMTLEIAESPALLDATATVLALMSAEGATP